MMSENTPTLSDIAAVTKNADGFGSSSWLWVIFIFAILMGGFGSNARNENYAATNEILSGQKFDALSRQIGSIGDGICSSTYALNNSILGEGRALQNQVAEVNCASQRNTDALRYDMSKMIADTNATTVNQTQKILDALAQNKIESLQAEVNSLKTQNMFCGIPKINPYGYGVYPYANCGCGNNVI